MSSLESKTSRILVGGLEMGVGGAFFYPAVATGVASVISETPLTDTIQKTAELPMLSRKPVQQIEPPAAIYKRFSNDYGWDPVVVLGLGGTLGLALLSCGALRILRSLD